VKSEESILRIKSYAFAIRVVELNKYLAQEFREYVLARQVLRSGTAIGALIREAEFGQSRADFSNKMSIALKEANETKYWLDLLKDTSYIDAATHVDLGSTCNELIRMLVATVKTTRKG
jgi:four helix bundle protein